MAIIETDRTINNLIKITSNGINIASYIEVKNVLINQYKNIYGNNIDLASNTADGIYIENLSLIISKILQCFNFLYSNLNIQTAQNTYLDSLCALTNIYRNTSTQSVVYLSITNKDINDLVLSKDLNISFIDNANLEWTTLVGSPTYGRTTDSIILKQNEPQTIPVYCKTFGPIQAKIGWLTSVLTNDYNIEFTQLTDAVLGSNTETDSELKLRRDEIITSSGITILQSLKGALLSIIGIKDVKIYNNNTTNVITALDNTNITSGSVYIIINMTQTVADTVIGNIIYNKMTPGIKTSISSNIGGTTHTYIANVENNFLLSNQVNWKQTTNIKNNLTLKLTIVDYDDFEVNDMIVSLVNYLNNLSIGQSFYDYEILNELSTNDIENNNTQTFIPQSFSVVSGDIIVDTVNKQFNTKDTCFNLSTTPVITQTKNNNISTITLTW